jgi:nitrogen fixation negative regulator NifL
VAALEQAAVSVVITDVDGTIQYVNAAFEALTGYTAAEAVGKNPRILKSGQQDAAFYREMWSTLSRGQPWTARFTNRRKDGELFHQLTTVSVVRDPTGAIVNYVSVGRDISREISLEAQLVQALEYARTVVQASPVGTITYKASGDAVTANAAASTIVGGTIEQLEAQNFRQLESWRRSGLLDAAERALASGEEQNTETQFTTTFGREVAVESRFIPFLFDGESHLLAMFTDVTQRKRANEELGILEKQFRQAQKMEAVGRLAGGVAHDFNNLMSVVISYAELMASDLEPKDPMRTDVEEIRTAGLRAAHLTRQLLAFSRQQVLESRVIDLNELLTDFEKMLRRLLGADIELVLFPGTRLWPVEADPGQLGQILMNLVINARDAMPQGGRLLIETKNLRLAAELATIHGAVPPGSYVMLSVSDTGVGMDEETEAKIFEPFFTTKEEGKGTGLGLATVLGIVKQSGGHIWVKSQKGAGTTFFVCLARVTGALGPSASLPPAEAARGTGTILLVEDDDQVRTLARGILRRSGYVILEASNAGEALLICEKEGPRIHLLLTDVVMPRMSGPELAERLGRSRPEMKILFMTGYTDDSALRHGVVDPGVEILQKPFTPSSLTEKVRRVLRGQQPRMALCK